jgi:hypothetical protein
MENVAYKSLNLELHLYSVTGQLYKRIDNLNIFHADKYHKKMFKINFKDA